jgi:hypothetical protein
MQVSSNPSVQVSSSPIQLSGRKIQVSSQEMPVKKQPGFQRQEETSTLCPDMRSSKRELDITQIGSDACETIKCGTPELFGLHPPQTITKMFIIVLIYKYAIFSMKKKRYCNS